MHKKDWKRELLVQDASEFAQKAAVIRHSSFGAWGQWSWNKSCCDSYLSDKGMSSYFDLNT